MLKVSNVSYAYGETLVLDAVSFALEKGTHLAVMGESGCGKSTLLKAIYGLLDLPSGQVFFDKKEVKGPAYNLIPGNEKMKYLAQDSGLMPYHTVAENVGKFLSNRGLSKKQQRVYELLTVVGMERFANRKAVSLSGGEKQRVALATALAKEPELLLLDEPFSQIDQFRKNSLQKTLFSYLKSRSISCVIATHDDREALAFSDKLLIMRAGKVLAHADTQALYEQTDDAYTASLFGETTRFVENGRALLLKPHQIASVPLSDWKATVKNAYFQGNGFLIEALSGNEKVYFFSKNILTEGTEVCLSKTK